MVGVLLNIIHHDNNHDLYRFFEICQKIYKISFLRDQLSNQGAFFGFIIKPAGLRYVQVPGRISPDGLCG